MTEIYADIHREIVERSQRGDQKSQYRLYSLYSKAMYNICLRMMRSQSEAEDMLQEAFADAFRKLHTFRFDSSFGAWLKRIVVNRCINELKRKRVPLIFQDEIKDLPSEDNTGNDDFTELNVKKIYKALHALPEGYRIIFSLYLLEGYDHQEISEILNISESTSKTQYMRAKRKIQEIVRQMPDSF